MADYVHERLSDNEVKIVLENQVTEPGFAEKVNGIRIAGNLACKIGS